MLTNERLGMVIFIFDTGKIENSFYGDVVFENIVKGKEVSRNSHKIVFSEGDIFNRSIYEDITPFIINDEICTIKKRERYKSVLYGVLLEDVEVAIAIEIDARLKIEFPAYIGMSSVDIKSTDNRKQFWKLLIRCFSIEVETITSFGTEDEDSFTYIETAKELGFNINYDGFDGYYYDEGNHLYSTRQSTFIQSTKQLEIQNGESDSDRGILEMNFALVKEAEIAGVMIWKAVEDINLAHVPNDSDWPTATDYIFTSMYQASQGIERLLKIVIQLIMYSNDNYSEKELYEKQLYSHNHIAMVEFIANREDFKLKKNCKNFVKVLFEFYKNARYNRFRYSNNDRLELTLLQNLGSDIKSENYNERIKHRFGRLLGETAQALFKLIEKISNHLNIYVYELNYDTYARYSLYSYYGPDLYETLKRIEKAKRELLWHLINKGVPLEFKENVELYPPLEFEEANSRKDLIENLINGSNSHMLFDFVSHKYDELVDEDKEAWKERLDFIDFITNRYDYMLDEDNGEDILQE